MNESFQCYWIATPLSAQHSKFNCRLFNLMSILFWFDLISLFIYFDDDYYCIEVKCSRNHHYCLGSVFQRQLNAFKWFGCVGAVLLCTKCLSLSLKCACSVFLCIYPYPKCALFIEFTFSKSRAHFSTTQLTLASSLSAFRVLQSMIWCPAKNASRLSI